MNMAEINQSFLGTGWSFPPTFNKISFTVDMVSDYKDIEESLTILLSTTPGERLMNPKYGCNLRKFVFEKIDPTLITEINDCIEQAILHFEPRVSFINAELVEQKELEGRVSIIVSYTIIITNTRHNIVFPFYKLEGTNVNLSLTGSDE